MLSSLDLLHLIRSWTLFGLPYRYTMHANPSPHNHPIHTYLRQIHRVCWCDNRKSLNFSDSFRKLKASQ